MRTALSLVILSFISAAVFAQQNRLSRERQGSSGDYVIVCQGLPDVGPAGALSRGTALVSGVTRGRYVDQPIGWAVPWNAGSPAWADRAAADDVRPDDNAAEQQPGSYPTEDQQVPMDQVTPPQIVSMARPAAWQAPAGRLVTTGHPAHFSARTQMVARRLPRMPYAPVPHCASRRGQARFYPAADAAADLQYLLLSAAARR